MRRIDRSVGLAMGLALALLSDVRAADAPSAAAPRPPKAAQVAEEALEAVATGDRAALEAIARREEPDVWSVADRLVRMGARDAAKALAAAATDPSAAALAAYVRDVETPQGASDRAQALELLPALRAAKDHEGALARLASFPDEPRDVLWVRAQQWKGVLLDEVGRFAEASAAYEVGAGGAHDLGWLMREAMLLDFAGDSAREAGDRTQSQALFERAHRTFERQGARGRAAECLLDLGVALVQAGNEPQAIDAWRRAAAQGGGAGRPGIVARAMGNLANLLEGSGDAQAALEARTAAVGAWRDVGETTGLALALARLARLRARLGQAKGAREGMVEARALLEAGVEESARGEILWCVGQVLERLGESVAARAAWEEALAPPASAGPPLIRANLEASLGTLDLAQARPEQAMPRLRRAAAALLALGAHHDAASTHLNLGRALHELDRLVEGRAAADQALECAQRASNRRQQAEALALRGSIRAGAGEVQEGLADLHGATAALEGLGEREPRAAALYLLAKVHHEVGDLTLALREAEEARAAFEALGLSAKAAECWKTIGAVHLSQGRFRGAVTAYRRALAGRPDEPESRWTGFVLLDLGASLQEAGNYLEARVTYERALAIAVRSGDAWLEISLLSNLGAGIERERGAEARLEVERRLLARAEALGNTSLIIDVLRSSARLLIRLDRAAEALPLLDRAGRLLPSLDALSPRERASEEGWLAYRYAAVHHRLGDPSKARECAARAVVAWERAGDMAGVTRALISRADGEAKAGRPEEALASYAEALASARRLGLVRAEMHAQAGAAVVYESQGRTAEALEASTAALGMLRPLRSGLTDDDATEMQRLGSHAYFVGVRASAALEDPIALLRVLELGRAGAMLDALEAGESAGGFALPPPLRAREEDAREAEAEARRALDAALAQGDAPGHAAALDRLTAARDRRIRLLAEALAKAKGALPDGPALRVEATELRAVLRPGEALVYYEKLDGRGIAIVVRRDGARLVRLGELPEEAVEVYTMAPRLRGLLAAPLALPPDVTTVLVCPAGYWADLPWSLLWPELDVALVPSGTILTWLRRRGAERGEGVLALGDPVYPALGSQSPTARLRDAPIPIPGTGVEARAIATLPLIGLEATAARLFDQLARRRWRAVHLACHGSLGGYDGREAELALTATADHDGRVTGLDFLSRGMPADVVVLSACHSGEGRVVEVEGILGLPRALLLAGARSVVASVDRVDDEATVAFMRAFHARLKEGAGPARALGEARRALGDQASPAGRAGARFVVWGLPD